MGWANNHIAKLQAGEAVEFRPRGNSMTPTIKSGQLCTVVPIGAEDEIEAGDIVLCKANGNQYLHLVKAVQGNKLQIGNNHGRINGWTSRQQVFGKLTRVD
jgi:phage repressor protein C with HTH and peptisase S24 domain